MDSRDWYNHDHYSEFSKDYLREDLNDPVGACARCGGNIYPEDHTDGDHCENCFWYLEQAAAELRRSSNVQSGDQD